MYNAHDNIRKLWRENTIFHAPEDTANELLLTFPELFHSINQNITFHIEWLHILSQAEGERGGGREREREREKERKNNGKETGTGCKHFF